MIGFQKIKEKINLNIIDYFIIAWIALAVLLFIIFGASGDAKALNTFSSMVFPIIFSTLVIIKLVDYIRNRTGSSFLSRFKNERLPTRLEPSPGNTFGKSVPPKRPAPTRPPTTTNTTAATNQSNKGNAKQGNAAQNTTNATARTSNTAAANQGNKGNIPTNSGPPKRLAPTPTKTLSKSTQGGKRKTQKMVNKRNQRTKVNMAKRLAFALSKK